MVNPKAEHCRHGKCKIETGLGGNTQQVSQDRWGKKHSLIFHSTTFIKQTYNMLETLKSSNICEMRNLLMVILRTGRMVEALLFLKQSWGEDQAKRL